MKAVISARNFDDVIDFLNRRHPEIPRTFRGANHFAVEVDLPDRTEDFLRLLEPLGRFKTTLCGDGTLYLEFHNDYD